MLRRAFLFDRSLYGDLCRSAYAATRKFFEAHFPTLDKAVPAMVVAPQSFGSLANHHPHCHSLVSLGVFTRDGIFQAPTERAGLRNSSRNSSNSFPTSLSSRRRTTTSSTSTKTRRVSGGSITECRALFFELVGRSPSLEPPARTLRINQCARGSPTVRAGGSRST